VQALQYKVVLGSTVCKLCCTSVHCAVSGVQCGARSLKWSVKCEV